MKIYIVDAFSESLFNGNQAGVVMLNENEEFPSNKFMINIASELKHSETVYVKYDKENKFIARYFTPLKEVDFCGHATIGLFAVLLEEGILRDGTYELKTINDNKIIQIENDLVWIHNKPPKTLYNFKESQIKELTNAINLNINDIDLTFAPRIVNANLSDAFIKVKNEDILNSININKEEVIKFTNKHNICSIHPFAINEEIIYARDFAPAIGIDEECATGTANTALTYALYKEGLLKQNKENIIIQGKAMGRESTIITKINNKEEVSFAGKGKVVFKGSFM